MKVKNISKAVITLPGGQLLGPNQTLSIRGSLGKRLLTRFPDQLIDAAFPEPSEPATENNSEKVEVRSYDFSHGKTVKDIFKDKGSLKLKDGSDGLEDEET